MLTKRQRLGLAALIPSSAFLAADLFQPTFVFSWKAVILAAIVVISQAFVYGDK